MLKQLLIQNNSNICNDKQMYLVITMFVIKLFICSPSCHINVVKNRNAFYLLFIINLPPLEVIKISLNSSTFLYFQLSVFTMNDLEEYQ